MKKSDLNLVWLDCEMSGLNPQTERILEIAVIVTDAHLQERIEGPVLAVHQSEQLLSSMDAWNRGAHTRSGLVERVKSSTIDEEAAQEQVLEFLRKYVPKNRVPLCGNSIGQDRRFLRRYMPKLDAFFHYRNVDVSTFKELALRWNPALVKGFKKAQRHTALADVHESIDELLYYRQHFCQDFQNP